MTKYFITSVFLLFIIIGCHDKDKDDKEVNNLILTGKRYRAFGTIEAIDIKEEKIRIRHGEIEGFMEPMTMWFKVADIKLIEKLRVNDHVHFELAGNNSGISIVVSILKSHK